MGVEPHPALPGGVVIQTAKLLERSQQPRAVQDLVMKPDRLEVLARHRCQEGLIGHFPCLTESWTSRSPGCKRLIAAVETKAGPSGTMAVTTPADHAGRSGSGHSRTTTRARASGSLASPPTTGAPPPGPSCCCSGRSAPVVGGRPPPGRM